MENTLAPWIITLEYAESQAIKKLKLLQMFLVKIYSDTCHFEKRRNFKEISEVTIRSCTAKWMFLKM